MHICRYLIANVDVFTVAFTTTSLYTWRLGFEAKDFGKVYIP